MNQNIIINISKELNIKEQSINEVLNLLKDGNTVPFIARYRKEQTGGLDEEEIRKINEVYMYEVNLLKRKEDVIRLIDEKELLTDDLKNKIMLCNKLVEVEDLYRPYKEKKKTKATEAIALGLEPLAIKIMTFPDIGNIDLLVEPYLNDKVKTKEEAITLAGYIISEMISDNAIYRKWLRDFICNNGMIVTKEKKDHKDTKKIYEMYYEYEEKVKYIKPHRILALNRAENEKVITVNINIDKDYVINYLENKIIKNENSYVVDIVKDAIKDSFKRLIEPSIDREIRSELTVLGEEAAISNFASNLEALLLASPMKEKVVLAFDPGFVNGCKIAVIDKIGTYLDSIVVKPFLNNINESMLNKSKKDVLNLIIKYNVDIVAIGNGTAARESEKFISELIKENNLNCKYLIVSEAGASIYSASKVALEEFPDLAIEKRSAVSIGRRLQDPLSELVKIPPEGIGVGLYQHDVSEKKLKDNLDFVVEKAVNSVGVNINTASSSLLKYVSGINSKNIEKIITYRETIGKIKDRKEIKKLLTSKTYEQAIGFLRVLEGSNVLDQTDIHPESYPIVLNLLKELGLKLQDIGTKEMEEKLNSININEYIEKLNTNKYTLQDIIESLKKPNRDPRDSMPQPILKSDILDIKNLKIGYELQGTVRNVIDFGAFIDIGLHNDALAHISKLSKNYLKHPSEVVSVGDIVTCYVIDINEEKQKVSVSLIKD